MLEFWRTVTDAQATIISALLTVFAAVSGVLLGSWLFGGRVRDLKGSVQETEEILKKHKDEVETNLSALREGIGKLRGDVNDIQTVTVDEISSEGEERNRNDLRDSWIAIRDEIERIAAGKDIDGRTRAKYGRIDRRNYGVLIEALNKDGFLNNQAKSFLSAAALWQRYKSGRAIPSQNEVAEMQKYKNALVTSSSEQALD